MREEHGVGVECALGPRAIAELAAVAEGLGYASFWVNVVGPSVDPFSILHEVLGRTRAIACGLGVIPIDRFPATTIVERLGRIDLGHRVIVGVAAGQLKQGIVSAMRTALRHLKRSLPQCRVGSAGYGPKVLALTGAEADLFLANWLTPARFDWALEQVRIGADAAGRPMPPTYLYHRCAAGADAASRLRREILEYRKYPVHQRHQLAMGNPEIIGVAAADPTEIAAQIAPYAGRCQVVFKPLARDATDAVETAELLRFFAPR